MDALTVKLGKGSKLDNLFLRLSNAHYHLLPRLRVKFQLKGLKQMAMTSTEKKRRLRGKKREKRKSDWLRRLNQG